MCEGGGPRVGEVTRIPLKFLSKEAQNSTSQAAIFESYVAAWPLFLDVIPSNTGFFSKFALFIIISEEMADISDVADDDDSGENNEMNERLKSSFWCSCQRCELV